MGKGVRGEFPKEKKEKPKLRFLFFLNRLKAASMTGRGNSRRRRRRRRCGSSPRHELTDWMEARLSESGVPITALLAYRGCDCAVVVLEWLKFCTGVQLTLPVIRPLLSPGVGCVHHTAQEKEGRPPSCASPSR